MADGASRGIPASARCSFGTARRSSFRLAAIPLSVTKGVPLVFKVYPGGHDQSLWSARAPAWLGLALRQLSPARPA